MEFKEKLVTVDVAEVWANKLIEEKAEQVYFVLEGTTEKDMVVTYTTEEPAEYFADVFIGKKGETKLFKEIYHKVGRLAEQARKKVLGNK